MGSLIDDIKSWKLDSSVQQIFLDWLQEPAQGFNIHERTPDYFWGITENDLKSTFNLNQRKQIAQHIKPGGEHGGPFNMELLTARFKGDADTLASAPSLDPGPVSGHSMTFETLRHADGNPMMAQDGLPLFYVDHGSVKNQLLCWVNKLAHGLQTCTLEKPRLPPLYLNGLIKTGKTHILRLILPALVRSDTYFGLGGGMKTQMCHLDFLASCSGPCYKGKLRGLLYSLLQFGLGKGQAVPSFADDSIDRLESDIKTVVQSMPYMTFYMIDEVQEWYLVEEENVMRARVFLKYFLLDAGRNAAFVLTGSSLSIFWMNVAKTPTNGYALLQDGCRVDLPADAPLPVMDAVWNWISKHSAVPAQLQMFLPHLPSLAVHCCHVYQNTLQKSTALASLWEFSIGYDETKLNQEVKADLGKVLPYLTRNQRLAVKRLVGSDEGIKSAELDYGLLEYFKAFMNQKSGASSLLVLKAPWHRRAIAGMIDEDGNIVDAPMAPLIPVRFVHLKSLLVDFGEEVNKQRRRTGGQLSRRSQAAFQAFMKRRADFFRSPWQASSWTRRVLKSEANHGGGAKKFRELGKRNSAEQVAQIFVMLRNILCHSGLNGTEGSVIVDQPLFPSHSCEEELMRLGRAAGYL